MSKKIGVIVSIVMMVVILATILSFSFAWFSASQKTVYARDGVMTAASPDPITTTVSSNSNKKYCGETGTDIDYPSDDFPYRAFNTITVTVNPSVTSAIIASISGLRITLPDDTVLDSKNIDGLKDSFSWDLYYVQTTNNEPIRDAYYPCWHFNDGAVEGSFCDEGGESIENTTFTHYFPASCFGESDNFIRDISGAKLTIPSIGKSTTFTFIVVITFLDQASACAHKEKAGLEHPHHDVNETITPFKYSTLEYMNTSFSIDFNIGQAQYSIAGGGLLP